MMSLQALRTCPVCRTPCWFVTPSSVWPANQEDKDRIVAGYKAKLGQMDCRYWNFGANTCPFGTSCFYRHVYPDGRPQVGSSCIAVLRLMTLYLHGRMHFEFDRRVDTTPLRQQLHLQRLAFAQFDCCICPWCDRCSCEIRLQSVECIGPVCNDKLGWVQIVFATCERSSQRVVYMQAASNQRSLAGNHQFAVML